MRNLGAVILAAGESSRLGQPKQSLTFRGETLLRRAVRAATEAGCDPVIIVVGGLGHEVRSGPDIRDSRISHSVALENGPPIGGGVHISDAMVVENVEWRKGIGTSIRRGVEKIANSVEAVVLLASDQPFVDGTIIAQLIQAREETGKPIVASSYANTLGVPALFDRSCFEALSALPDDSGAKTLIRQRPDEVASIAFENGAIDIDTWEDFARLTTNSD
jgi:molybdenum cofactor cytidylyltransferase